MRRLSLALEETSHSYTFDFMNQIRALLKTTWWLWLIFFSLATVLYLWVDPIFVVVYPICLFTMIYFAFVRFDEDGDRRES